MALSEAERAYFMEDIAVHMAARNYPNQISGRELTDISQIAFKSMTIILKLRRRCNGFPSAAVR